MASHATLDGGCVGGVHHRQSAWSEHEAIASHILSGNAKAAATAAEAHAQDAGQMTEERLRAMSEAA